MKKFMKKTEGFTLVELIVVIAILGILAGVGTVGYSGYVKKANMAADQQLLATLNQAVTVACFENNVDLGDVTMTAEWSEDGKSVTGIENVVVGGGAAPVMLAAVEDSNTVKAAKIVASFELFYAGNETAKFKLINEESGLNFVPGHGFISTEIPVEVKASYAGSTVILNSADIGALKDSTFLNASGLGGSAGLLDQVNEVTNIATGMAGSLSAVFNDPSFAASAMAVLGIDDPEAYKAKQVELIGKLMESGMTKEQAKARLQANSAVLYAAESAVNFSDADIKKLFSDTGIDAVKANLKGANTVDGMAQAALIYGMYTAYANSEKYGNATLQGNMGSASAVLDALENDANFKTFVNSDQGKTDMDAYLGALNMLTDSAASSPSAVEHLMLNGFNNADLKNLLGSATGK